MVKLKIEHDSMQMNLNETMIIATDNSGAIGEKELDIVKVPYDVVAYYLFRVVFMECVAANGHPEMLILQNFNGDTAWEPLLKGIEKGLDEVKISTLPITGSSESNFNLKQSATSLSLIGRQLPQNYQIWEEGLTNLYDIAVVGKPLVGDELFQFPEKIAQLEGFNWLSKQPEVVGLIPVGSKGIQTELNKLNKNILLQFPEELNLEKSAGPSTCYIVVYQKEFQNKLEEELSDPISKGVWMK